MKYVALLRGIGPANPNMHQKKLVAFFEKLKFKNVGGVISSGNVIFETSAKNIPAIESKIEKALPRELGFSSMTIVRSQTDLEKLVARDPFKGKTHTRASYLLVSFLKNPEREPGGCIFTVIDTTKERTPNFMVSIEKKYDKAVTSRTWKTILRILEVMQR